MLLYIGLRCEWARSKARADRWDEEVQLVMEEMRRVLTFLEWKAAWWDGQQEAPLNVSHGVLEGAQAYAAKQAHVNRALAASFRTRWSAEPRHEKGGRVGHDQGPGEADVGSRLEFGAEESS